MRFDLTEEAIYRLNERLGIMYADKPVTPFEWENLAMAALRWQRKHDSESPRFPVYGPKTPIMEAE